VTTTAVIICRSLCAIRPATLCEAGHSGCRFWVADFDSSLKRAAAVIFSPTDRSQIESRLPKKKPKNECSLRQPIAALALGTKFPHQFLYALLKA
jgi:hypothetical protein